MNEKYVRNLTSNPLFLEKLNIYYQNELHRLSDPEVYPSYDKLEGFFRVLMGKLIDREEEDLFKEDYLRILKEEVTENKKCKLPWTRNETKESIFDLQSYIAKIQRNESLIDF